VSNPQDEDDFVFGAIADQIGADERELSAAVSNTSTSIGVCRQVLGGGDQLQ
jgi:hypothetical protein